MCIIKNKIYKIIVIWIIPTLGTTIISAFKLNRKSIGFEIYKDYINIFENRVKSITKQSTKQTFITINKDEYINLNEEQIKKN